MKSHLQVKVVTLSAEMTYIRKQELRWKKRAQYARQKQAEVKDNVEFDRRIAATGYAEQNFWTQRYHRNDLKVEARNTHLAYGCMRGRSYQQMEQLCYGPLKGYGSSEPNWQKIEDMVARFSKDEPSPQDYVQKFAEWLADAKLWYEGNPDRIKAWEADRPARIAALEANKKPYVRPVV